MYYRIYLDTLFFVNLFMDYCILTLVSKILRCTTTHLFLRRVFGATFGALWLCVAIAFKIHNFLGDLISYILVPGVMNYILLGKCELRLYLKGIALLYAIAATLGGMLHWLYYYTIFGYLLN